MRNQSYISQSYKDICKDSCMTSWSNYANTYFTVV